MLLGETEGFALLSDFGRGLGSSLTGCFTGGSAAIGGFTGGELSFTGGEGLGSATEVLTRHCSIAFSDTVLILVVVVVFTGTNSRVVVTLTSTVRMSGFSSMMVVVLRH